MSNSNILDETSLASTLWNLEEARIGRAAAADPAVKSALSWIAGRQGTPGSYRGLFAPTAQDYVVKRAVPTGEACSSLGRAGVAHILGEEAVHALSLWGCNSGWDRDRVLDRVRLFGCDTSSPNPRLSPKHCCSRCSVARLRAVAASRLPGWEDILCPAVDWLEGCVLADRKKQSSGFPFYYALLTLSEFPLDEVETLRRKLRPAAERAFPRIKGDDLKAVYRRRAVAWALA